MNRLEEGQKSEPQKVPSDATSVKENIPGIDHRRGGAMGRRRREGRARTPVLCPAETGRQFATIGAEYCLSERAAGGSGGGRPH
jgi:hypothetical protein